MTELIVKSVVDCFHEWIMWHYITQNIQTILIAILIFISLKPLISFLVKIIKDSQ